MTKGPTIIQPVNTRYLANKEVLFKEGEKGDSIYLIVSGIIKIYTHDEEGKEIVLSRFGENQIVGEMSFVDGSPRSAWAVAEGRAEIMELPTQQLRDQLKSQPKWIQALIESLVTRLRQTRIIIKDR